jgi:hypothetical protein
MNDSPAPHHGVVKGVVHEDSAPTLNSLIDNLERDWVADRKELSRFFGKVVIILETSYVYD